jgi:DNA-directed RNA polymerase subunit M/transcription elongation factor TFIIS
MKFCDVCNNMLYVSTDEQTGLVLYCKNCNFRKAMESSSKSVQLTNVNYSAQHENVLGNDNCIMNTNYSDDARSYKQFLTPNIKYDMTLPRVNNIPCPKKCSNGDGDSEVIYIKYDQTNMKYLYFCCKCEHFWKLD